MPRRPWLVGAAVALAIALVAGACGGGGGSKKTTSGGAQTFAAGTTMAALQAKGKITVGTKFDQPGFGQRNPTNGQVEGFDVEMAKLMAVGIFGGTPQTAASKINFVDAVSAVRQTVTENGTADQPIATYT